MEIIILILIVLGIFVLFMLAKVLELDTKIKDLEKEMHKEKRE